MEKKGFVKKLESLRKRNTEKSDAINFNLYKLLCDKELLIFSYERIKNNKGVTMDSKRVDNKNLDGFSLNRLNKLIINLKNETWKPRPSRRIYIPKPGTKEKRPLGIQGLEEKIVQAAMLTILESIYEPIFYETSFGFRPGKGCHDALKSIDLHYTGMTYVIKLDVKGMYDNINKHILISLIKKKVKDDRFIGLIYKILGAGYMTEQQTVLKPVLGTPQGSIVSPIFANIYLHELDAFMHKRVKNRPIRNPTQINKYGALRYKRKNIMEKIKNQKITKEQKQNYIKTFKALSWQMLNTRRITDPSNRIHYTRYADDFIVGIAGSYGYTEKLKNEIIEQLKTLNLTINEEKTKIINLRKENTSFLGHNIKIDTSIKYKYVQQKGKRKHLKKVTGKGVSINPPKISITHRLMLKGFCTEKGFPTHKKLWITQEDHVIIENFNAIIRGLFGFYSGVKHPRYLNKFWYILQYSCIKTLAAKHRCSIAKIIKKHKTITKLGNTLKVNYGQKGEKLILLHKPNIRKKLVNGKQVVL